MVEDFVHSDAPLYGMHSDMLLTGTIPSRFSLIFSAGVENFSTSSAHCFIMEFDSTGAKADIGRSVIDSVRLLLKRDAKLEFVVRRATLMRLINKTRLCEHIDVNSARSKM